VKLSQIAARIGCALPLGAGDPDIERIASADAADSRSITFLSDAQFRKDVEASAAAAVIVKKGISLPGKIVLEVDDPYLGYARAARLFEKDDFPFDNGIHSSSVVHASARVHASVRIGPHAVIGPDCAIGESSWLGACCVMEHGAVIGSNCRVRSGAVICRNVTIGNRVIVESGAIIGSEGFGNARAADGSWERIPSMGTVIVEDDAWIGANTTIDRAAFGATVIGRGARVDNLVQIAHNVVIGEHTAIAAQTGISGSTTVGKRVILAGQTGFVGHITIGDDAFVGAKAGVSKDVAPGAKVTGYPARDFMKMRRIEAAQQSLPELVKTVKKLREEMAALKEKAAGKD
jgi:UDP-3-O-[3-hydroxymyristoyl] glucosamine N-acyltransferase